ncbi:MAG: HPr family phosphocarrier protein [Oscillospiraceae bacterium]|jgi:phosphotransferase system HPr-like phosphotransfer protein|nr:HPr family phosphocarrier protein [Oscillospiraceae bacterium]
MKSFNVLFDSIGSVKRFVAAACQMPFDIDVIGGRYVIDAKSIMGIFSIDLSKPVRVEVHGTDEDFSAFKAQVETLVVE